MKIFSWNVPFTGERFKSAKQGAQTAVTNYTTAQSAVAAAGNAATTAQQDAAKAAARELNAAGLGLKAGRGEVIASGKYMFSKLGGVFGIKPSAKASAEYATKIGDLAGGGRANIIQRIVSKPMRVMGNNPKTTLFAAGAIVVSLVAGKIHRNAEKRTQKEVMDQALQIQTAAEAQQAANAAAYPYVQQAPATEPTSYKNSVTPEAWAATNQQFRENMNGTSHADRLAAQQQASIAPSV